MTAPIDIACPTCKALPGRYCVTRWRRSDQEGQPYRDDEPWQEAPVDYHHAARVDAAMGSRPIGGFAALVLPESLEPQLRDHLMRELGDIIRDGNRLREALKEALDEWERLFSASEKWGDSGTPPRITELRKLIAT